MGGEKEIGIARVKTIRLALFGIVAVAAPLDMSGEMRPAVDPGSDQTAEVQEETLELQVTGYCNCGKCCGWRWSTG